MPKNIRTLANVKGGDLRAAPTAMSLFSGCGGMDLGFMSAGFNIVWANDIDSDAADTYKKNLGHIVCGDIRDPKIMPDSTLNLDVLLAGFPCQAYSNAGSRQGTLDKRGTLYRDALKYVERFSPRLVLFENVRGLLSIRVGGSSLVEEICHKMSEIGYSVYAKLLNASHYGVPQRRLRLFIVGVSNKVGTMNLSVFPDTVTGKDLSIGKALSRIPKRVANRDELMPLNPQALKLGEHVPPGGSWKSIPNRHLPPRLKRLRKEIVRYRWPNFYRRFDPDEIAGTVTAAFKPENAGVWHPSENRVMSVREVARLQTFPDDFAFVGASIKSKYRQIGNAVPPALAKLFGRRFIEILDQAASLWSETLVAEVGRTQDFHDFFLADRPLRPADPPLLYNIHNTSKDGVRAR